MSEGYRNYDMYSEGYKQGYFNGLSQLEEQTPMYRDWQWCGFFTHCGVSRAYYNTYKVLVLDYYANG